MINFRPIFLVNGMLLGVLSVLMLVPLAMDLVALNEEWEVFAVSSFFCASIGGVLFFTNRGQQARITVRDTFLLTTSCYVILAFAASLPLYLSGLNLSFTDALFEATSGITATGATVLSGLDEMPPGILIWRSLLNALGGVGIVVLAMAVLPMLQIGGMQLFKSESSETMDKLLPRATQLAGVISVVFGSLMFLCAFSYWLAGMEGFDAINHAMTTVATGGFSTHDTSIAHYDSLLIECVAMLFMLSGALPIILYYQFVRGDLGALARSVQVRWLLSIIATVTLILVLWLGMTGQYSFWEALRYVLFSVISIITTTGYASADYSAWGGFAINVFFILIVVGGCTGSTSGGIKIFRFKVFYETAKAQMAQLMTPRGVFLPRYEGRPIPKSVSQSVMSFLLLFGFCFIVLSIGLSAFGLDFLTSMSAAAQALSNVGPGLGETIGPAGNYASLPEGAKWLIAAGMIIGRLELFTALVLLLPTFWRE